MPFFQSMAVRFGVKSFLENCGIDEEAAGWLAAGASLTTALVTADLHGHLAGEAVAHGVHHATGHVVSHGASHAVSHGTSHAVSHGSAHVVSHTTQHTSSHAHHLTGGHEQRTGQVYKPVLNEDVPYDVNHNYIGCKQGDHFKFHSLGSSKLGTGTPMPSGNVSDVPYFNAQPLDKNNHPIRSAYDIAASHFEKLER